MKKNAFIYMTAFFCGMSVMAVELSASRLLAPYFGTSQIIWTVIIGFIMISLSIGNILGGRAADKYNSMDKLFGLIWIAAIWIAVIPLLGKYIIALCVLLLMWIMPSNLLIAGSILSCMIIFSFPLIILGMASPYLVKMGVKDMKNNGKTTGEIYALSTIGSIIGTFIPTFLTIPYIGTNKTFFVFSLVLNILCAYYFINAKIKKKLAIVSLILVTVLIFSPISNSYAFWEKSVVEDESLYNYLRVTENEDEVILSTNVAYGVQSILKKNSVLSNYYYDYTLSAPMFIKDMDFKQQKSYLVLGMGTGTYAKESKYFYPKINIVGVEIDQKIVDLSKKYFELEDEDAVVYVNDGRTFLRSKDAGMYDIIQVDAYHDITIPFHMSTKEFFSEVKEHLNPGGVLVINMNMRSEKHTELTDYLKQTVKSNFSKAYFFNISQLTNSIIIASDDESCLQNYEQNIKKIPANSELFSIFKYVDDSIVEITESKLVFTDDLAPVEVLGQKLINDIISQELSYIKTMISNSNGGIKGIIDFISGS